jgi:hypothetical protein
MLALLHLEEGIGKTKPFYRRPFWSATLKNTPGASSCSPPMAAACAQRRRLRQHPSAAHRSSAQQGVARLFAVRTGGVRWASLALQGFAGAAALQRTVPYLHSEARWRQPGMCTEIPIRPYSFPFAGKTECLRAEEAKAKRPGLPRTSSPGPASAMRRAA